MSHSKLSFEVDIVAIPAQRMPQVARNNNTVRDCKPSIPEAVHNNTTRWQQHQAPYNSCATLTGKQAPRVSSSHRCEANADTRKPPSAVGHVRQLRFIPTHNKPHAAPSAQDVGSTGYRQLHAPVRVQHITRNTWYNQGDKRHCGHDKISTQIMYPDSARNCDCGAPSCIGPLNCTNCN